MIFNDAPAQSCRYRYCHGDQGWDIMERSADMVAVTWMSLDTKISQATITTIKSLFYGLYLRCLGSSAAWVMLHLFGGYLDPMITGLAMSFSSVSVVTVLCTQTSQSLSVGSDRQAVLALKNSGRRKIAKRHITHRNGQKISLPLLKNSAVEQGWKQT